MLRIILLILLFAFSFVVSANSDEYENFDVEGAVKDIKENKALNQQMDKANKQALKANPENFTFDINLGQESELVQSTTKRLLEKANSASVKVNTNNHGEITQAQYTTGIADEEMAEVRYNTLLGIGIDPKITGYIFVSESMPESLIRAYSRDATRLGMSLVFFGFTDKGSIENKFLTLSNKYHTKRNAMSLQVDTRLYDVFNITEVPSIVVTDIASMDLCNETGPVSKFSYQSKVYQFNKCNPLHADRFCKISGSVFTDWALKEMSNKGCDLASNFLIRTTDNPPLGQNTINKDIWESYINSYVKEESTWTEYEKEVHQIMQGDFK